MSSQNSTFYSHNSYDVMETLKAFSNDYNSTNRYLIVSEMKKELEWENDYLEIYLSCDECPEHDFYSRGSSTGINWGKYKKYYFPLVLDSYQANVAMRFSSDETLNYRGVNMKNFQILFKPDGECNKGDNNLDGLFNVVDVVSLVNIIFEVQEFNQIQYCACDINSNDLININDIVILVENILN